MIEIKSIKRNLLRGMCDFYKWGGVSIFSNFEGDADWKES